MSEAKTAISNVSSLKNMLVATKSTEIEYPGMPGFKVKLEFLSRDVLQKLRKKATNATFKRGAVHEDFNEDLFLKLYVESSIKGWTGLTMEYLSNLAPIDLGATDPKAELEFSEENALQLMKSSSSFDSWISETVSDLGNFQSSSAKT